MQKHFLPGKTIDLVKGYKKSHHEKAKNMLFFDIDQNDEGLKIIHQGNVKACTKLKEYNVILVSYGLICSL